MRNLDAVGQKNMSQHVREENWHSPDTLEDLHSVKPPGEVLGAKEKPWELRYYSVRRRAGGIALNFYTRKRNKGVPSYGITLMPEQMLEMCEVLKEAAQEVLRRQGRRVDDYAS